MSFTCPSCLWASRQTRDVDERYCGHCHEYHERSLNLNLFQTILVKALLGSNAESNVLQVVAQRRRDGFDWASILEDLLPLAAAGKLLQEQRRVLLETLDRVNELRVALE